MTIFIPVAGAANQISCVGFLVGNMRCKGAYPKSNEFVFTHAPCSSVGQQTFSPSSPSSPLLLLLHTFNFLFILGTENAVGGVGPSL